MGALVRLVTDRAADPRKHRTKVCLLLGAGADISSGGLTFAQLKRRAVEDFTKRRLFDLTPDSVVDRDFDELFLELEPDERALLVEAAFGRMQQLEPSEAYKLLVLLAEAGGIDAVITTNFDLMLERAQEQLGRDLFQVFAPGIARPDLRTHPRYEQPKKPYLKVHGDLASRTVVYLTQAELASAAYDEDTVALIVSILKSHDLIIAGYSGFDGALAEAIGDAVQGADCRVYWCNPSPPSDKAPLARRVADRATYIELSFDELMVAIARPVLEKPSLAAIEPTFVQRLLDWRVDYCSREYTALYGQRFNESAGLAIVRRGALEEGLTRFLGADKPLAVVTGPSGFGKTILGIRLAEAWRLRAATKLLLARARALPDNGDIERYIGDQLSGLGARGSFSLFRLEAWLRANDLQLVVFIDGLNEFSPDFARCVALFRSILRFCYFLPEVSSSVRIITTIRQETWNAMLPNLDLAQLNKVVWSPAGASSLATLACEPFSDEELRDAVRNLGSPRLTSADLDQLPPVALEQLRDPYLFGVVADGLSHGLPTAPVAAHYRQAFAAKLRSAAPTSISSAAIEQTFAADAAGCLEGGHQRFRELDVGGPGERSELVRLARDLNIIRDAEHGFLQFEHERTFEYFLATAIALGIGPPLETLADLEDYLARFRTDGRALAAARLHVELHPERGLTLISGALGALDRRDHVPQSHRAETLFQFGREGLAQLAENGDALARTYIGDAVEAGRQGRIGELHLKAAVQAAAMLPVDVSIPLLAKVRHPTSSLPGIEAHIYAIDRLAKHFLTAGERAGIDLLTDQPYASYFSSPDLGPLDRLGRLAGYAMQLGPDNTCPDEYGAANAALASAFARVAQESLGSCDASAFSAFFLRNCDRLLFNSTDGGVRRFFGNPRRHVFRTILDKLEGGAVLDRSDFDAVAAYTQAIEFDLEYQLCVALFVASSLNDVDATLRLAETCFSEFDCTANPVQVDFLEEVIVYTHVLHGLDYDESRFTWWEAKVLEEWPEVLLYRPGLMRGEIRGFSDPFDRIFEDGFSVVYPYGILRPARHRRSLPYAEYVKSRSAALDALPLYTRWLEHFLADQRIDEALQLMQGIAGVIIPWPLEGLPTLRPAIGHPDPRIRRAVVRILAEAYNRHPGETLRFLRAAGVALTDDELLEIKVRSDARLGRRQIAEEEWARLLRLLLGFEGAREHIFGALKDIVSADSAGDATARVFQRLGLAPAA